MGEVAESKSNLVEQHREWKRKYNETRDGNPDKEVYRMKMKNIEDALKSDKFTRIFDEDMQRDIPKSPPISKEFIEDLENKYRQIKRDQELRSTEEGKEQIIAEREQTEYQQREQGINGVVASAVIP